ncbi:MAG TPA: hypothetical protein VIV88_18085 [Gemmatimonadales bacterium]|jgi:hypothetical protein
MGFTRRGFLGCVAGSLTARLSLDLPRPVDAGPRRVLLDLGEHCRLRESVAGYESALAGLATGATSRCRLLIVPAALDIPPPAVETIVGCLRTGATVLLESGAGFAADRDFRAHRAVLRDHLGVHVEAPVRLWSRPDARGMPYVDYSWPASAQIRDFSRVVPLGRQSEGAGEIIAWVDGLPVALKRPSGRGTLIFLGSPLGPALWAGDAEARRWFGELVVGRRSAPTSAARDGR